MECDAKQNGYSKSFVNSLTAKYLNDCNKKTCNSNNLTFIPRWNESTNCCWRCDWSGKQMIINVFFVAIKGITRHFLPHDPLLFCWNSWQYAWPRESLFSWWERQAQGRPPLCNTWQGLQVRSAFCTDSGGKDMSLTVDQFYFGPWLLLSICQVTRIKMFLWCFESRTQVAGGEHEPAKWHSWPPWRVSNSLIVPK